MGKRSKKMVFAGIFAIAGLILILAGGLLAFLVYSPLQIIQPSDILLYVIVALIGLAFVLELISLVIIAVNAKARKKEEEKLMSEISASSKGEKLLLAENGRYYQNVAKTINRSRLLRKFVRIPYGVYKESRFDDIVLDTLENEVTAKAGLVYFVLNGDKPIRTKAPRDALLVMVKSYFGEKAYYGLIHNGVAVFCPFLPSKEEFLGRIRRTVQIYSYTDTEADNHIASKAGVAFYPDFAPRLLTSEALKGTLDNLSLNIKEEDNAVPHLGYNAAELEAFLLHKERFYDAASKAVTVEDIDRDFNEFVEKALPYVGADSLGLAIYREEENQFEILFESHIEEGASFSALAKNNRLEREVVDPFYEWSINERGRVYINDAIFLPSEISARLDALGVASLSCYGVGVAHRPLAFIYATGKEKNRFDENRTILEFLDIARDYVLNRNLLTSKENSSVHEEAILSAFDHYAYGVSKDSFNLSHVSPNLTKAIPQAKVGKVCYEALFGLKKPCEHCPLIENNVEKMIPRLASGVFAYKTIHNANETLLVLSPHKADFSPSRIDPYTGLLSDKSLHEDLQGEILLKDSEGVILAFRIRNVDAIARLVRLSDYEEVVKAVSDALASAGLARGLYRNGVAGFAYLLPYASRQDAYALADKICRKFSEKLLFQGREIEFVLDYVLISYPLEAETPFALDAILRILYQRADASSRGRLFEVNNEKGRLVDMDYYMKTKLEEGLRAKRLPVAYAHYDELAGKHMAFLEASLVLEDEMGARINPKMVNEAANSLARGKEIHLAIINTVSRFLGAKRKEMASTPFHGVIVKVDASCFSESFLENVVQMLENNKAYRKHLFLEVDEDSTKSSLFPNFKRIARAKGLNIALANYKGDLDGASISDYAYVSFPAKSVYGAAKQGFLLSLSNVRRVAVNVLIDGYRDFEEKRYLASLTFHYGKKAGEELLKEEDIAF